MRTTILAAAMAFAAPAWAQDAAPLAPAAAIAAIEAAPDLEVAGAFEIDVESTGASGYEFYLNSDADYRAAGNFTFQVNAEAANDVKARFGDYPDTALKGKRVRVTGVGKRYHVGPEDGGYFQYRVEIDSGKQIVSVN